MACLIEIVENIYAELKIKRETHTQNKQDRTALNKKEARRGRKGTVRGRVHYKKNKRKVRPRSRRKISRSQAKK